MAATLDELSFPLSERDKRARARTKPGKMRKLRPLNADGLVVKPSLLFPEAGNGLFATRDFRAGEYITWYDGSLLHKKIADVALLRDPSASSHFKVLTFGIGREGSETGLTIDAKQLTNPDSKKFGKAMEGKRGLGGFINTSTDPKFLNAAPSVIEKIDDFSIIGYSNDKRDRGTVSEYFVPINTTRPVKTGEEFFMKYDTNFFYRNPITKRQRTESCIQ